MGNLFASTDRFSAHFEFSDDPKGRKFGDFLPFQNWQRTCNNTGLSGHRKGFGGRIGLIPRAEPIAAARPFSWEGGSMYLLFGPSMAALVVIAVIQLRDHFVASR
jgi:hypothetical protein